MPVESNPCWSISGMATNLVLRHQLSRTSSKVTDEVSTKMFKCSLCYLLKDFLILSNRGRAYIYQVPYLILWQEEHDQNTLSYLHSSDWTTPLSRQIWMFWMRGSLGSMWTFTRRKLSWEENMTWPWAESMEAPTTFPMSLATQEMSYSKGSPKIGPI